MAEIVRRLPVTALGQPGTDRFLTEEWLVTNGLGGYASSTVLGATTRRYHGLLIAALPAPFGRMVMLSHLYEHVIMPDGSKITIGDEEQSEGELDRVGFGELTEFRLEQGLPVWVFDIEGTIIEKRVTLVHMQNTVHVTYKLVGGSVPVEMQLRPSFHIRDHHAPVSLPIDHDYALTVTGGRYEVTPPGNLPSVRMLLLSEGAALTIEPGASEGAYYRLEASRGYESEGTLWCPGSFHVVLKPDEEATLVASTEPWETLAAVDPAAVREAELNRRARLLTAAGERVTSETVLELTLAADQFIITPATRVKDAVRAHAAGDDVRTVIAGYHWFTDWGRDTMISLPGLALATGRHAEAGYILRTFAEYVHDGLIPNMFPDAKTEGLYHTADATLWYFHAIDRYVQETNDRDTLRLLLPRLESIVDAHIRGTRFGIHVDPIDELLVQGEEGLQLTWMDAKVGDWVVTPRRGKAVEINALWYNALRLLEGWVRAERGDPEAQVIAAIAARVETSFNERFWYADGGYLYDVVDGEDGDDSACRPNQIFAISLPHAVLDPSRWDAVLNTVQSRLLTPVGLRSLAPGHPNYKPQYFGDLLSRDAAYHQGTVWAWLIGPFVDAWLKVHPGEFAEARGFLDGLVAHLGEAGIGTVSEVFDATEPYTPRGCIAQAWSVAELLRCLLLTEGQE